MVDFGQPGGMSNDTRGSVVEVVLGDTELVEQSVVETTPRNWSTILSVAFLGGLLAISGALLLVPGLLPTSDSSDSNNPASATAATDETDDAETDESSEGNGAADGDDGSTPKERESANSPLEELPIDDDDDGVGDIKLNESPTPFLEDPPALPLLPGTSGSTLVVITSDEVVLLNTDDGSRRTFSVDTQSRSEYYYDDYFASAFPFGSSVLLRSANKVMAVSIEDGSVVDYGDAAAFWKSPDDERLYLLRGDSYWDATSEEQQVIEAYDVDHRRVGDDVVVPQTAGAYIYPVGGGLFVTGGAGIFRYDDGFDRITTGSPFLMGSRHLAVTECTESLVCSLSMIDRATGESEPLALDTQRRFYPASGDNISPTGDHVVVSEFGNNGPGQSSVIDLATGDAWPLSASFESFAGYDGDGASFWSGDGRYLVLASTDRLRVYDVIEQTEREIDLEDLELENVQRVLGLVELSGAK